MLQPPVPSLRRWLLRWVQLTTLSRVLAAGVKCCRWLPLASGRASPVTGTMTAALETQEPHAGAVRARVSARAVPMEWLWWLESAVGAPKVTRPRSECYQGGQFYSHAPTSFQHDVTRLLRPQRASGPTSAALSTAHRCSDPAESPSQRKGQLAGLAHALSRARTGSRGAPGPSGRPPSSLRPTRGALTTAAAP